MPHRAPCVLFSQTTNVASAAKMNARKMEKEEIEGAKNNEQLNLPRDSPDRSI